MGKIKKLQEFIVDALDQFGQHYFSNINVGMDEGFEARLTRLEEKIETLSHHLELLGLAAQTLTEQDGEVAEEAPKKKRKGPKAKAEAEATGEETPKKPRKPNAEGSAKPGRKPTPESLARKAALEADELLKLPNFGEGFSKFLRSKGIETLAQVAELDAEAVEALNAEKPSFKTRWEKNNWGAVAAELAQELPVASEAENSEEA